MIQERLPHWPVIMGEFDRSSASPATRVSPLILGDPSRPLDASANRYWFKKGQEDAREPAFFAGLLVGWASAAAVWGGLVWWLG